MPQNEIVSLVSLGIAFLAVLFGPIISLQISKQDRLYAIRKAWKQDFQNLVSQLLGLALHYEISSFEDRTDSEYKQLAVLQYKISLLLASDNTKHGELENSISEMISALSSQEHAAFQKHHIKVFEIARKILAEKIV